MFRALLVVAALLFPCAAYAQCVPLPYTLTNGTIADANQVMANFTAVNQCAQAAGQVASNAALGALLTANVTGPGVWRMGYAVTGDAPPLFYVKEAGTCVANSRVNDSGSCVNTTSGDGNSFYAVFDGVGVDPRQFGAKGDGATDDTVALQAAITAAPGTKQNVVWLPALTFCVKTAAGLSVTNKSTTIISGNRSHGQPYEAPTTGTLSACGTNSSVITLNANSVKLQSLQVTGAAVINTTHDAILMSTNCDECIVEDVRASGGRYAINATGAFEVYLLDVSADSTYGQAIVFLQNTSGYIRKGKFDQAYPQATPAAGSQGNPVPAWVNAHLYATGTLAISNGYILQATIGGTSAGVAPVPPLYGSTVVDGGVTWGLVGASTYYGVQCDTGCGSNLYIDSTDFSGDMTIGLAFTNSLSGASPHLISVTNSTFGSNVYDNISFLGNGYLVQVKNNTFGGGLAATGGTAISLVSNGDDNIIEGNLIIQGGPGGGATGVFVDANNVNVENNIFSVVTGVSVAAGVTHFRVIGNSWFSGFGASTNGVFVASGASDFYDIIGNDGGGTTTSVSDGGTGVHKTVIDSTFSGNFASYFNTHIAINKPNPTVSGGLGTGATISGSDAVMRINTGTGPTGTPTVNFGATWQSAPVCIANNESNAANVLQTTTSTTQLSLFPTANLPASGHVSVFCMNYQ